MYDLRHEIGVHNHRLVNLTSDTEGEWVPKDQGAFVEEGGGLFFFCFLAPPEGSEMWFEPGRIFAVSADCDDYVKSEETVEVL